MGFFNTILVPTDFSLRSESAYRYALELAVLNKDRICLLNVVSPPYEFPSRLDSIIEERIKAVESEMDTTIRDLKSVDQFKHLRIDKIVKQGKIVPAVLNAIEEIKPGLVVMGIGSDDGLKKLLFGSVTNSILLDSEVPVLAIPENSDYKPTGSLVFTTDLRNRDIKIIREMRLLAAELGSEFHTVHIITENEKEKASAFEKTLKNEISNRIILETPESESFFEGITAYLKDQKNAMVIMPRYKKTFLEWMLLKSKAREIALYGKTPLLMVPAEHSMNRADRSILD